MGRGIGRATRYPRYSFERPCSIGNCGEDERHTTAALSRRRASSLLHNRRIFPRIHETKLDEIHVLCNVFSLVKMKRKPRIRSSFQKSVLSFRFVNRNNNRSPIIANFVRKPRSKQDRNNEKKFSACNKILKSILLDRYRYLPKTPILGGRGNW